MFDLQSLCLENKHPVLGKGCAPGAVHGDLQSQVACAADRAASEDGAGHLSDL